MSEICRALCFPNQSSHGTWSSTLEFTNKWSTDLRLSPFRLHKMYYSLLCLQKGLNLLNSNRADLLYSVFLMKLICRVGFEELKTSVTIEVSEAFLPTSVRENFTLIFYKSILHNSHTLMGGQGGSGGEEKKGIIPLLLRRFHFAYSKLWVQNTWSITITHKQGLKNSSCKTVKYQNI